MVPYQLLAALSDHWSSAVIEEMACDVSLWFCKRMLAGPALKTTDDNLYLGSERLCRAFFPDFIFLREWIHATEIKSLWRLICFPTEHSFYCKEISTLLAGDGAASLLVTASADACAHKADKWKTSLDISACSLVSVAAAAPPCEFWEVGEKVNYEPLQWVL